MRGSRERYAAAVAADRSIPVFMQPWWLDALAGEDGWDAAVVDHGGTPAAVLPYTTRRLLGRRLLGQPPLTQHLGPWILGTPSPRPAARQQEENRLLGELADLLPPAGRYLQAWSQRTFNHLPFHWRGFEATVRYTYAIEYSGRDEASLLAGLDAKLRREIRGAGEKHGVRVEERDDPRGFLALNQGVFERQGMDCPYSWETFEQLDRACRSHDARRIFFALGEDDRPLAAVYVVHTPVRAYYLAGGSNEEGRRVNAPSLALWKAVLAMRSTCEVFDFEGSMIQPIERHVRRFGGERVPYLVVSRTDSRILRTMAAVRHWRSRR